MEDELLKYFKRNLAVTQLKWCPCLLSTSALATEKDSS